MLINPRLAPHGVQELLDNLKRLPVVARYCPGSPHEMPICNNILAVDREAVLSIEALLRTLLIPQEDWQPIETAPRMRTVLLFAVSDIAPDGTVKNWKMGTGSYHTGYDDEQSKRLGLSPWEWGHRLKVYELHPTH